MDRLVALHYETYHFSIPTSLTIQWHNRYFETHVPASGFLKEALKRAFEIHTFDAVKIGHIPSSSVCRLLAKTLKQARPSWVVLDPVINPSSAAQAFSAPLRDLLTLMRHAHVITPTWAEAKELIKVLKGHFNFDPEEMASTLRSLLGVEAVFLKMGDVSKKRRVYNVLALKDTVQKLPYQRLKKNVRGTGCIFSTSLACELAMGHSIEESVRRAQSFTTRAVRQSQKVMKGYWTWTGEPVTHL